MCVSVVIKNDLLFYIYFNCRKYIKILLNEIIFSRRFLFCFVYSTMRMLDIIIMYTVPTSTVKNIMFITGQFCAISQYCLKCFS